MDLLAALGKVLGILDGLGVLERVKQKLLSNPDVAAEQLAAVLSELGKSYEALDAALVDLATLTFDTPEDLASARLYLMHAQGGRVVAEIADARGHCRKISNIYDRHLRGWFSRALDRDEAREVAALFEQLQAMDTDFVLAMDALADEVPKIADNLLHLLNATSVGDAEAQVRLQAREWREPRRRLSQGLTRLHGLKADLITASGAV